jgi:predicted Zn finger-like uncharacterized protein
MRVICEKCRSAYAIEDAQVPPTGARTQCPRCNHVQIARPIVKKGTTGLQKAIGVAPSETFAPSAQPPPVPPRSTSGELALKCKSCGAALTDPFDQALGTCDSCREKASASEDQGAPAAPPKKELMPELFDGHEHHENHAQKAAPITDLPAAPPKKPTTSVPRVQRSVVMTSRRRGVPGWVWGVAVVVIAAAGGAYYYLGQPTTQPPRPPVATRATSGSAIERLKARHPKVTEDASALVVKGRNKLVEDRPASYDEARSRFEEALVSDPRNSDAAWGLAEAVALGFPQDAPARAEAKVLLDGVPVTPRTQIARAELLLADGGPAADEKARALVLDVLPQLNGEDAAFAHLALGRTYSRNSANLAIAAFDQALKESGRLVRTYTLRGIARASAGDYRGALADLQQRLALDPDHWSTLDALGRIDLEVGRVTEARQLYVRAREAAPSDIRPTIALAQVLFQAQGKPDEAVQLLQGVLRSHSSLDSAELARVNAQLAAAHHAAGDLPKAAQAAEAALAAVPNDLAAHFQLTLIELARDRGDAAAPHLNAVKASLPDPALAALLEGRVAVAQGKFLEAGAAFERSANADPRRVDALLWAGAAYASAKRRDAAEPLLMRALQSDPTRTAPADVLTDLYVRPAELLRGAEGRVEKLATGDNDVMPRIFEALIRFHQHDLAGADRMLKPALAVDESNVLALSLRALVELADGRVKPAQVDSRRAVTLARQVPLARYAAGASLLAGGELDAAKEELNRAHQLAPGMAAAELKLAEIEARTAKGAAKERLGRLLAVDPSNAQARHALFALEVE